MSDEVLPVSLEDIGNVLMNVWEGRVRARDWMLNTTADGRVQLIVYWLHGRHTIYEEECRDDRDDR